MLELPEAYTLARQLEQAVVGKAVETAAANSSPHKWAWFSGDPALYGGKLRGLTALRAEACGGMTELHFGGGTAEYRMIFHDGSNVVYHEPGTAMPDKHQLIIRFSDGSAMTVRVQMYGAILLLAAGESNDFNETARAAVSPLSDAFDFGYFSGLYGDGDKKQSVKAFLATKQRIPGLGNGVLQDILWNAQLHPKRKMGELTDAEFKGLFNAVKSTLRDMTEKGGRDTETDLYGRKGGYSTRLSKLTVNAPCPRCGGVIAREAYMGGNVYYCTLCQTK